MTRHAYLIIAHDKYHQLKQLLNLLDDCRNDIYVHIDKKSPYLPDDILNGINKSCVYIIPDSLRIDVRWGDVSQIQCELLLYSTAYSTYKYGYYHLLSGYDLPIKSNNYIHSFFERHDGKNFIGFGQYDNGSFINKIGKIHLFTRLYRDNTYKKSFIIVFRYISELIVNGIFPSRCNSDIEYRKGANWCSLTGDFVEYMLSMATDIIKHYRRSCCGDEIYKQTLIYNSSFRTTIYNLYDEFDGCLRLIDWNRGTPYIWGQNCGDENIIQNSKCLFARKFDMDKYPNIINFVINILHQDAEIKYNNR